MYNGEWPFHFAILETVYPENDTNTYEYSYTYSFNG